MNAFDTLRKYIISIPAGAARLGANTWLSGADVDRTASFAQSSWEALRQTLAEGRAFDVGELFPSDTPLPDPDTYRTILDGSIRHPYTEEYTISMLIKDKRSFTAIWPTKTDDIEFICVNFVFDSDTGVPAFRLTCGGGMCRRETGSGHELSVVDTGFGDNEEQREWAETRLRATVAMVLITLDLLANSHIEQTIVGPTPQQVKSRRRLGLKSEPPYIKLTHEGDYRTLLPVAASSTYTDYQGGTHASPVMHERRGHWRMRFGRRIWVRACTVNPSNPGPVRTHYEVHA